MQKITIKKQLDILCKPASRKNPGRVSSYFGSPNDK